MTPRHLLEFGSRFIRLFSQDGQEIGAVSLEVEDLSGELRTLIDQTGEDEIHALLVLPEDQALFTTLDLEISDSSDPEQQVARALEGRTPYAIDQISFDWTKGEDDSQVHVAAIAHETLEEAAKFAAAHGVVADGFGVLFPENTFSALPRFNHPDYPELSTAVEGLEGSEDSPDEALEVEDEPSEPVAFVSQRSKEETPEDPAPEPEAQEPNAAPTLTEEKPPIPQPIEFENAPVLEPKEEKPRKSRPPLWPIAAGIGVISLLGGWMLFATFGSDNAAGLPEPDSTTEIAETTGFAEGMIEEEAAPEPVVAAPQISTGQGEWRDAAPQFGTIAPSLAALELPTETAPAISVLARAPDFQDVFTLIPPGDVDLLPQTATTSPDITAIIPETNVADTPPETSTQTIDQVLDAELGNLSDDETITETVPEEAEQVEITETPQPDDAASPETTPESESDQIAEETAPTTSPDDEFVVSEETSITEPDEEVADLEETETVPTIPPRARPTGLVERSERARFGGRTLAELAAISPRQRPVSAQQAAGADPTPTEFAVALSRRPNTRPDNMQTLVAQAQAQTQTTAAAPAELAAASTANVAQQPQPSQQPSTPSAPTGNPSSIPSNANVAQEATVANAIALNRINLIAVAGAPSDRRALVRMPSGRIVRVKVGDRIDGGRVAAIGDDSLAYEKGGRQHRLTLPKG